MKRVVAVVLLVVLVLSCVRTPPPIGNAQLKEDRPIVVSERVGDVIDAEEREQFGLFPAVDGFKEARFYPLRDGGYELRLITEAETLLSVNSWPDAVLMVREYIDDYEAIVLAPEAYKARWSILDYDTLGIPITEDEVKRSIRRNRTRARMSCLGCMGVSCLVGLGIFWGIASSADSQEGVGPAAFDGAVIGGGILVAGIAGGLVLYFTTYKKNPDVILKRIKESRKPFSASEEVR